MGSTDAVISLRKAAVAKILVVDDDALVCDVLTGCLQKDLGAEVKCALTGEHGALMITGMRFDLTLIGPNERTVLFCSMRPSQTWG